MGSQTYVYIVCSPRGRVGVTTAARLLGDYFLSRRRNFIGFDTDPHESPFALRFPQQAKVADLASVKGQIALFDRLLVSDETPKVVDLWARSWKGFFNMVREIGFLEEARRQGVTPIFLLAVDNSNECLDAVTGLLAQWPDLNLALVRNRGAAGQDDGDASSDRFPPLRDFEIPALDPVVAHAMERADVSLSRFLLAPPSDMSIVVKSALRTWLSQVFAQIQSFELRMALGG